MAEGTVLVVDDDHGICDLLERRLRSHGFDVLAVQDGTGVLGLIAGARPDVLLLDAMMPHVDGLTLCRWIRAAEIGGRLPIILMSAAADAHALCRLAGADAVIRKPFNMDELVTLVTCLARSKQAGEQYERVEGALVTLAALVESRSLYHPDHLSRVARHATQLVQAVTASREAETAVRTAALLHDIGKIGVPEGILAKPGPLTKSEFEQIKRHTVLGAQLCGLLRRGDEVGSIVRGHHERWDGAGYPDGLAGEGIPLGARAVAVADAFDALTTDRPYRRALTRDEAFEILWFGAGEQWDPDLVEVLDGVSRAGDLATAPAAPPDAGRSLEGAIERL